MRIISGEHKGRRLLIPKNLPVRPTTDFAKEALFNILKHRVALHELKVLDLFSGTGSISFEFASRGAKAITSIDSHDGCVKFIEKTAQELAMPIEAVKSDALKFLEKTTDQFDLIFVDPPYDFTADVYDALTQAVWKRKILKPEGLLILEHTKRMDLSGLENFTEARKYGDSLFSFFSNNE